MTEWGGTSSHGYFTILTDLKRVKTNSNPNCQGTATKKLWTTGFDCQQTYRCVHTNVCLMNTGVLFSEDKDGRILNLTITRHLVPRIRIRRCFPTRHQYTLMAWF